MRTVGVEEEFLLVDTHSAALRAEGEAVADLAASANGGQYDAELKSEQVELGTPPEDAMRALDEALRTGRRELAVAAAERSTRLAALATSPARAAVTATGHHRYERMHDEFGMVATMQLTCGMHVHVSVADDAEGVAVLDAIRPWLPGLVAITANSPFWDGADTGYASYRSVLWGQWPTAGPTEPFGSPERYREVGAELIASGAAIDEGMLYFAARLSSRYPTVEIRVADVCPRVADAVVVAALARALVDTVAAGPPPPPVRQELLRAAHWRAARHGTGDTLVDLSAPGAKLRSAWDVIGELYNHVRPALVCSGDDTLVHDGLDRIRRRGTGARAQRDAFARRRRLDDVVDRIAELTRPPAPARAAR